MYFIGVSILPLLGDYLQSHAEDDLSVCEQIAAVSGDVPLGLSVCSIDPLKLCRKVSSIVLPQAILMSYFWLHGRSQLYLVH